ncbi:DNA-3-methyladenine glycosylase I [Polymorphum gilvum]|uniref:Probable DNA glycosylase protein n=1 Tax=Polymorphum gilvum (strain LMG 25793 / CGMCC 1.9160 / SL003B-26A1) TaxID=991905 RepID=F2IZ70_POLGS|nr:DNA-3-methyladenine glycosylase I [Polymorphum gilvum]ADZ71793.1 Probable DNA glycosylase protein [Polymorphum gilvum SL003B-26A1]
MRSFHDIRAMAAANKGGEAALSALLGETQPRTEAELAAIGDDRWLAMFTRCIFQAGFNWKVIDAKWPGFEEAFEGFDPARIAHWPDERLDALASDARVVRNAAKIHSVRDNALFLRDLARNGGSASAVLAAWPASDQIGLMDLLKTRGSRLGGNTGQYALRFMGKESFILSASVLAALRREGIVDGTSLSKKSLAAIQGAFNQWKAESGASLTEISRILAFSHSDPD